MCACERARARVYLNLFDKSFKSNNCSAQFVHLRVTKKANDIPIVHHNDVLLTFLLTRAAFSHMTVPLSHFNDLSIDVDSDKNKQKSSRSFYVDRDRKDY